MISGQKQGNERIRPGKSIVSVFATIGGMIEFVFKPSRRVGGKRVLERLYSGRYALGKGEKPVTVRLNTPDKLVACKRLRDIVVEQQQEREGIILPKSIRQAAATS